MTCYAETQPEEGTLWRFIGSGPCRRLVYRVITATSTEIIAVAESAFTAHPTFLGVGNVTLWSWLGDRFCFFNNFEFLAGPASGPFPFVRKQ